MEEEVIDIPTKIQIAMERSVKLSDLPTCLLEDILLKYVAEEVRRIGCFKAAIAVGRFLMYFGLKHADLSKMFWMRLDQCVWESEILQKTASTWCKQFVDHCMVYNAFMSGNLLCTARVPYPSRSGLQRKLFCRRLAVSSCSDYIVSGFCDGTVAIYQREVRINGERWSFRLVADEYKPIRLVADEYKLDHKDDVGVCGIIIASFDRVFVAFGSGAIWLWQFPGDEMSTYSCVCPGNPEMDGQLVDFSGTSKLWVGLYSGGDGRSFHIWKDGVLFYVGGTMTVPFDLGKIRLLENGVVVACTPARRIFFHIENPTFVREFGGIRPNSFDANNCLALVVALNGTAMLCRPLPDLVAGVDDGLVALRYHTNITACSQVCLNRWFCFYLNTEGHVKAWDTLNGDRCCSKSLGLLNCSYMAAGDAYVAFALPSGITIYRA